MTETAERLPSQRTPEPPPVITTRRELMEFMYAHSAAHQSAGRNACSCGWSGQAEPGGQPVSWRTHDDDALVSGLAAAIASDTWSTDTEGEPRRMPTGELVAGLFCALDGCVCERDI